MNRTFKIIVSVVVCVWIFAMGLELGAYRERKAINAQLASNAASSTTTPTVTAPPATDPPPTQNEQPSSEPSQDNADPAADNADEPQNTSSKPEGTEAIVKAFNDAVNNTKNAQQNCNASQDTNVEVNVEDCSVERLTDMLNSIVQGFSGPEHNDYAFINGATSDGKTINDNLPPSSKACALTAAGVASAASEDYGNGGYKLTITLAPETGTLDTPPANHAASVGYLDLNTLDLPSVVKLTEASFNYPGATVTVCVNENGLLDTYESQFPLNGTGAAKVIGLNGTAVISGSMTENWVFTWA